MYDRSKQVHHKDSNGLNNCKDNLLILTAGDNCALRLPRKNKTGFIGVSYKKKLNKWESNAVINQRRIYIGIFTSPEEAAKARDKFLEQRVNHFIRNFYE